MRRRLGELLVGRQVITSDRLDAALAHQTKGRAPLGETLIELGMATADEVLAALSKQLGVPATRINAFTMDPHVVAVLPEKAARKHWALPLFRVGRTLTVAMPKPRDIAALDDLRFASGCEINPVVGLAREIAPMLDRAYGGADFRDGWVG